MWILKQTLQFLFISRKRERGADTNFIGHQKGKQGLASQELLI